MPGWITSHFKFRLSGTLALNPERQTARKSKLKWLVIQPGTESLIWLWKLLVRMFLSGYCIMLI